MSIGIMIRCCKGFIFIWLATLVSYSAYSQNSRDWRSRINTMVEWSDSLSLVSQKIFYLHKFSNDDRPVKETWYYTIHEGRILLFEVRYVLDSTEFSEIYYMNRGTLICMERYEVPYLSMYTDQVRYGEALFFDNDHLRQYVVCGKGRPIQSRLTRGDEFLQKFEDRYTELKKTILFEPRRRER